MATFYTGVDKSIYQGGDHYVPMDKFRLNPYEPKNLSYESESQPQSYGITNTNAFTNSGSGFNSSGNAFGYGSAIKPGDPSVLWGGKPIRSADVETKPYKYTLTGTKYGYPPPPAATTLKDPTDYRGQSGYYGSANYQGGLPGDIQHSGPGRHFQYDNTGNFYRDYSLTPKKEVPGFIKAMAGFVPLGMTGVNFIEKRMNPEGPLTVDDINKGRYAMGGLDALDKKAYNELAGSGMLFEGSAGVKTSTGKNFAAKGYFEGQQELAEKFGFDKMSDEEIEADIARSKLNKNKQFEYKQKLESYKMMNYKEEKDKQAEIDLQKEKDGDTKAKDYITVNVDQSQEFDGTPEPPGGQPGHDEGMDFADPVSDAGGDAEWGGMGWSRGGRVGFFAHGGRVYLNLGGLASIL
jgi:hypothetical protein